MNVSAKRGVEVDPLIAIKVFSVFEFFFGFKNIRDKYIKKKLPKIAKLPLKTRGKGGGFFIYVLPYSCRVVS